MLHKPEYWRGQVSTGLNMVTFTWTGTPSGCIRVQYNNYSRVPDNKASLIPVKTCKQNKIVSKRFPNHSVSKKETLIRSSLAFATLTITKLRHTQSSNGKQRGRNKLSRREKQVYNFRKGSRSTSCLGLVKIHSVLSSIKWLIMKQCK